MQVRRLRDAHARAANHDNVFHLRRQISGGQTRDHRPVAVADHRDMCERAQDGQILGERVQRGSAGSCQLFTRRISTNALWRVVPQPGNHGDVLAWRVSNKQMPVAEVCLLKNHACTMLEWVANESMQIFGGAGYLRGSKVERIYRETKVLTIGGGSLEIMKDLASKQMGY